MRGKHKIGAHIRSLVEQSRSSAGITLVELVVVMAITLALSSVALVVYMNQESRAQDTVAEAEIGEVARYLEQASASGYVVQSGSVPLSIPGQGFLAAPKSSIRVDPDKPGNFCIRTMSDSGKMYYWEKSKGQTSEPSAFCTTATDPGPEESTSPSEPPPPTVNPETVLLVFDNGTAIVAGTGTFADETNGTLIERSPTETRFYIDSANWNTIEVSYTDAQELPMVDTITKTGSATVGVLTRLSNKDVRISIPSTKTFSVAVVYSGNSTGTYNLAPS